MELSAGILFLGFSSSPFPMIFSFMSQNQSILKLDFKEATIGVHHSSVASAVRLCCKSV